MKHAILQLPMVRGLAAILLPLAFLACRTPYVPYACQGWWNEACAGYSEVRLAESIYQVRFEGNQAQDTRALLEDYTLLRCAELTLESGFDRFVVIRVDDETTTRTESSPGVYHGPTTTCSGKGEDKVCVTTPGYWSGGGTYTRTLPGYAYTIQFVPESAEIVGAIVYDPFTIQRDLRRKYGLSFPASVAAPPPN